MDIQAKKIHFVQEFLRIKNEQLIENLEKFLHVERKRIFEEKIKPMSMDKFNEMIDKSEEDSKNGRLTSAKDLKKDIDSWS